MKMNPNTYTAYWKKITAYFSGELNANEISAIEVWAEKTDNKLLLNEMKTKMKIAAESKEMGKTETDFAWNKLMSKIQEDKVQNNAVFHLSLRFYAVAASLVLFFGLSLALLLTTRTSNKLQTIQTLAFQQKIELPDGTLVYLNQNSSLTYPSRFESRDVKLIGEAFFDVKADHTRPFVIETEKASIQVLGTSFNVKTINPKGDLEVFVEQGKVRVAELKRIENQLVLTKGDFASLEGNKLISKNMTDRNYLAWKTKTLIFSNTSLGEVVETLNKVYNVQIVLNEEKLRSLALTSTYDRMEVNALLEAICLTFNLEKTTDKQGRIVVYSRI